MQKVYRGVVKSVCVQRGFSSANDDDERIGGTYRRFPQPCASYLFA